MTNTSKSVVTAMLCAAAVTAQFVGGKATRDALFLTSHDVTFLPAMLVVTALCSIVLVSLHARAGRLLAPAVLIPASFVASGGFFLAEWLLRASAPSTIAVVVYLHVSVAGPLLTSGFWLIVSELFSPRTAKKGVGRIAAAGTLGGLAGAIVSERVAATLGVPGMLLVLGGLQFFTAVLVRGLAVRAVNSDEDLNVPAAPLARPMRSGLRVIAETPYLRRVAALVVLGTTSAALVDYVFKGAAVEAYGPGDGLLRFFAMYYGLTSLVSFALQILASRPVLERFGIAGTTSTPSIALLGGVLADFALPGSASLIAARGSEAIFRGSWFRAGYELFFTPLPAAEKRATKSLIDVTFDRLGDAIGGALVPLAILIAPGSHSTVILSIAMAASVGAIVAASQLSQWYLRTLENSLLNRGGNLPLLDEIDAATATVLTDIRMRHAARDRSTTRAGSYVDPARAFDPILEGIATLRSPDRRPIIALLSREEGLPGPLVPHAIPLLAVDPLADYALFALRKVAEEHVGQLADALIDPNQEFAVRRRLARVFSVCVSQRAADGLVAALDDVRFDVRFQAARSLSAILSRNNRITVDPARIYEVVLKEVAVGRPVWEGRRLLDGFVSASPLDEFVRDRAGQSLAHVFTLLGLVLPREPLQIAFRSLQSEDAYLRGTGLEYLEGVLPAHVRQPLWPFLVRRRNVAAPGQQEARVVELLRSSESPTLQGVAETWDRRRIAGFAGV
jgi:hypothetical protein